MQAEFLRLLLAAEQEIVPRDLKDKGWRYQDLPGRFTPQMWDYLLALIGEGEYQILIQSSGHSSEGPWKRGQLLISPQGYANLQDPERQRRLKEDLN